MKRRRTSLPATRRRRLWRPLMHALNWLVIVALVGLLVMPVALAGPAGAGLITICTAEGPERIALDVNGRAIPLEKPRGGPGSICAFCAAHPGYTVPPPLVALLPPPDTAAPALGSAGSSGFVAKPDGLTGHRSRAPPQPAV